MPLILLVHLPLLRNLLLLEPLLLGLQEFLLFLNLFQLLLLLRQHSRLTLQVLLEFWALFDVTFIFFDHLLLFLLFLLATNAILRAVLINHRCLNLHFFNRLNWLRLGFLAFFFDILIFGLRLVVGDVDEVGFCLLFDLELGQVLLVLLLGLFSLYIVQFFKVVKFFIDSFLDLSFLPCLINHLATCGVFFGKVRVLSLKLCIDALHLLSSKRIKSVARKLFSSIEVHVVESQFLSELGAASTHAAFLLSNHLHLFALILQPCLRLYLVH